jgi:hypothetical protein
MNFLGGTVRHAWNEKDTLDFGIGDDGGQRRSLGLREKRCAGATL